jgi:hypothetical protein
MRASKPGDSFDAMRSLTMASIAFIGAKWLLRPYVIDAVVVASSPS